MAVGATDYAMGMFDTFNPRLPCPKCGNKTEGYQSYDGPCILYVFTEGLPELTMHDVPDDCTPNKNPYGHGELGLPDEFNMNYGSCVKCGCGVGGGLLATGYLVDGIWIKSKYNTGPHKCQKVDDGIGVCLDCNMTVEFAKNSVAAMCEKCHNLCEIIE